MPIAINGNVNGTQIWIPDHHWWDYPFLWPLPKRPEDGQLDWERLFPHQRDVVRRFSSILRTLWGLPPELPPVPYQPFGTPSPQGWFCAQMAVPGTTIRALITHEQPPYK